jgi:hypothetical protein
MKDSLAQEHIDASQLLFTMETSIRVVKRFQFFLWAQGSLQTFLPMKVFSVPAGISNAVTSVHPCFRGPCSNRMQRQD